MVLSTVIRFQCVEVLHKCIVRRVNMWSQTAAKQVYAITNHLLVKLSVSTKSDIGNLI